MKDDAILLREYAETNSQPAFTELVRRHVDMVYATALRRTDGNAHRAADVAQQVFTMLAQKAARLQIDVLGAWLHTATRNAAINLMISEHRRQDRERAAAALEPAAATQPVEWASLRPVLDEAIDRLPDADRVALVLRFLERKSFGEIGTALLVSPDAARMRTDRAMDKLRIELGRRGIASTSAAIAAAVAAQPLIAAPAALVARIAPGTAASAGAAAGLGGIKLVAGAGIAAALALSLPYGLKVALASAAPPPPALGQPDPQVPDPATPISEPASGPASPPATGVSAAHMLTVSGLAAEVDLALAAGGRDYQRGAKAFGDTGCAACHQFMGGGRGGIGPDLTSIGAKSGIREIIESIIDPSANVSDLYAKAAGTNPMPAGLIDALSKDEVIDLVAFLVSAGNPEDRIFRVHPSGLP